MQWKSAIVAVGKLRIIERKKVAKNYLKLTKWSKTLKQFFECIWHFCEVIAWRLNVTFCHRQSNEITVLKVVVIGKRADTGGVTNLASYLVNFEIISRIVLVFPLFTCEKLKYVTGLDLDICLINFCQWVPKVFFPRVLIFVKSVKISKD